MGQASKSTQISGKISEVNLRALTVKIAPKSGDSEILQINERTELVKGGKKITLAGIKKDDMVNATYQIRWRKKVALNINVQEKPAAPKKDVPATTPTKSVPKKTNK
jgi:hypothetical protein